MTYCGPHQISDWSCGPCRDSGIDLVPGKIQIVEAGATMAVVGKYSDQHGCLLAFRGSAEISNWVTEFRARLMRPAYSDCTGCRVEKGFHTAWKSIRERIVRALSEVGCSPATEEGLVRVTGHSLGGALTHLAIFDLESDGFEVGKSFSFEAPRVGNEAFSKRFSARFAGRLFRVTHFMDPVPHLPPRLMDFAHVQTEVYYDKSGRYKVCHKKEDRSCS